MSLDDFIVPTSVASPAGIPTPSSLDNLAVSTDLHNPSVPVKPKPTPSVQIPQGVPAASFPKMSLPPNRSSEFDYVQKRVRKTSIDERRSVSILPTANRWLLIASSECQEASCRLLSAGSPADRAIQCTIQRSSIDSARLQSRPASYRHLLAPRKPDLPYARQLGRL
jgi:hypothetical protein